MGRVLIEWEPEFFISRAGCGAEDAKLLMREVFKSKEWVLLDRGVDVDLLVPSVLKRLPEHLHGIAEHFMRAWWADPLIPMKGMAELVNELKNKGYRIYLLSNASSELYKYFHRLPGAACFDGLLVSADHGLLKPEHEIYELFLRSFGLKGGQCLFIDDTPINVEAAERAGMHGIVFHQDAAKLRRELAEEGIQVSLE